MAARAGAFSALLTPLDEGAALGVAAFREWRRTSTLDAAGPEGNQGMVGVLFQTLARQVRHVQVWPRWRPPVCEAAQPQSACAVAPRCLRFGVLVRDCSELRGGAAQLRSLIGAASDGGSVYGISGEGNSSLVVDGVLDVAQAKA